jgi:riboflavin kinase
MKQIVEEPLSFNLPDKEFFDLCHERYGVNRGVYNVIDHWFFRKGFKDIEARRNTILHFLAYLQKHQINKFGKGGVKNSLELYMTNPREKEVG